MISVYKTIKKPGEPDFLVIGVPYGTRTRVSAVKGQRPRPLDEGDAVGDVGSHLARVNQARNVIKWK